MCLGCRALSRGLPSANHSELCRSRVEDHIRVMDQERWELAEERLTHRLVDRVKELVEKNEEGTPAIRMREEVRQERSESSEPVLKQSKFQESGSSSSKDGHLQSNQAKQATQFQAKQSVQLTMLKRPASSEGDKEEKKI